MAVITQKGSTFLNALVTLSRGGTLDELYFFPQGFFNIQVLK
jgi:hypothetical protein